MKKTFSLLSFVIIALLLTVSANAQVYILNEDFSSAIGTTPPNGWSNLTVIGTGTDLWRFDNPGNRSVNYPLNGKVAIFDSQTSSGGGGAEKVSLESPFLDCSFSSNTLLYFDHQFVEGRNGKGTIEIYNGNNWVNFTSFTISTPGVKSEVFDVSALMGGITNAKFRFTWEGDSSNYWMVDNIRVLAPLSRDANLRMIDAPIMPFAAGVTPMKVTLMNEGYQTLTSATIKWTVNGVAQTPYSWAGNLPQGIEQNNIQIGTFNFPAGIIQRVKIWVESPNGLSDLNRLNDTASSNLAAALCGTYTIGGTTPSFANFTDAAFALNNAGVSCPVVFKVRNGSYNEQIKLYEILGSSAANTITFEGENGDSSLAELHYQTTNTSNDFTLSLIGTDYISFNKMGIRRTNGTGNMFIQNGAHHVSVQNCQLGNVTSPNTSCDSVLTFRYNNMQGYDLNLQNPDAGPKAGFITVENNYLNSLVINNARDVSVKYNRNNADTASYAVDFTIDKSRRVVVSNNRMRSSYFTSDTTVNISTNIISRIEGNCCRGEYFGVYLNLCNSVEVLQNKIFQKDYYYMYSRGVSIRSTSKVNVINNQIEVRSENNENQGIQILGASSKNLVIRGNSISNDGTNTRYGIYVENGDTIYIKQNVMNGLNYDVGGYGISLYNVPKVLEVDSNQISNYQIEGIHSRPPSGSNWKIRYNTITNIRDKGMYLEGTGGEYNGNRIVGVPGTGIVVNGGYALVANNYVQAEGLGIAKGISLQASGTGSSIVFNSVNITGTDVINGQALEVLGGTNYTIKNNIFANNGGGYASYFASDLGSFAMDYNDYFSTKRKIAFYNNINYDTLSTFSAVTGKDANSKSVNPYYSSVTNLSPNHTLLNGTGTAIAGTTMDIEGTLRAANPDMGAKEFAPCINDAGVNEFWGLSNPLPVGSQSIKVILQNQGTNTLTSATIQWEVNGVAQTPYSWTGSLTEKQNAIITIGNYSFGAGSVFKLKAWMISPNGTTDCDNFNDSCRVFDLGTPLCGVYTIGGTSPNFATFYDASVALNNAGIGCPVVFKVRNGSYNEQIKLYEILGSSATNTITFEGENGDSSLAELHYQTTNTSNDFTLSLIGTDYISFNKMGIRRTNGTGNMFIQNGAHHVSVQNCQLGNVTSPNTSCDSVLTFRYNNMQGYDLNLQNPDAGPKAGFITVENNYLNSLVINNARDVSVKYNRNNADTASYAVDWKFHSN